MTSHVADGAGDGGSEEPPHVLDVARFRRLNSLIHRENVDVDELLHLVEQDYHVNLMLDPLLSFVIACKKPKLACRLIDKISSNDMLTASNYDGDTALHVAAAMGYKAVASELIRRVPDLVHVRNRKQEIPLHKAALYGLQDMFWLLVSKESSPDARREDGATMLHCAIMGNAPELALQIARYYPGQITNVDQHGVTSLDLMLTIHGLFRSHTLLGFFESFVYDIFTSVVPSEEGCGKTDEKDAEALTTFVSRAEATKQDARRDYESLERSRGIRSRFPPQYDTLLDLLELICILARWSLFHLLKLFAVKYRREEIVKIIRDMRTILPSWLFPKIDPKTGNTILHLASRGSPDVAKEAQDEPDAMQLHYDLVWFETVRDMVPKELVHSRNAQTKTAEEMFTESHQVMLRSCKRQLMETGRTCSGLVAEIVFASSFSVPGDKDPATGSPVCFGRAAFKVFSHAYVFGLSCAATSLVLFLSLAMSPYKEQQFRRIIPTKYFFARSSFGLAMLSFLVAFTCNIYLQLYGWQKTKSKDLIPFVLELTVFPVICFLVLFFRGADFGISFLVRLWR
ncbi:uncharacterized protein LOC103976205 isoform X3 [Musa acuminata AAA Group]|uniref:uncharacterized protein LOC103976205 isoform X3 n=1 Tax=Musa acuminata AAA Group TaxID=214697 RepID=UPI0031D29979